MEMPISQNECAAQKLRHPSITQTEYLEYLTQHSQRSSRSHVEKQNKTKNKNKSGFNNKKSKNRETTPVNPAFIHKIFISIYFFIRPMPTHPSHSDNEFPIPKPPSCAFSLHLHSQNQNESEIKPDKNKK